MDFEHCSLFSVQIKFLKQKSNLFTLLMLSTWSINLIFSLDPRLDRILQLMPLMGSWLDYFTLSGFLNPFKENLLRDNMQWYCFTAIF